MIGQELCVAIALVFTPITASQKSVICKNADFLVSEAKKVKVDPYIFISLIYHESAFRPRVVSSAGACGLTQVLPRYSRYTCKQLKNPRTSIKEGLRHLRWWLTRAKGDERLALCGYNAGNKCFTSKKFKRKIQKRYSDRIIRKANRLFSESKEQ